MKEVPQDKEREARIAMEAVVDAYGEEERASGWYYYLEEKLTFPFRAKCISRRMISPLIVSDEVEVVAMGWRNLNMRCLFKYVGLREILPYHFHSFIQLNLMCSHKRLLKTGTIG